MIRNSFLTEIYKSDVPQATMDEVANIVLAYCMASMFLIRNRGYRLEPSHFIHLTSYLDNPRGSIDWDSMETASNTFDRITLRAPVSIAARNYIRDKLRHMDNAEFHMVQTIIDFVNDDPGFNSLVSQTTNNGISNRIVIDVNSISVDKPMETSILIDNDEVDVFNTFLPIYNFRTGIGGIGQKELDKDYGYESHRLFLNSHLGIDIGPDSAVYYQTVHNNGSPSVESMEKATRALYTNLCGKINQGFDGAFDSTLIDFKQNIIQCMIACCYGVDISSDGTCLILGGNTTTQSFNVKELFAKIYNNKLQAKCPENVNPSIRIVGNDNKELFKVRFKKEIYEKNLTGHRYKMYFMPSKVSEYLK